VFFKLLFGRHAYARDVKVCRSHLTYFLSIKARNSHVSCQAKLKNVFICQSLISNIRIKEENKERVFETPSVSICKNNELTNVGRQSRQKCRNERRVCDVRAARKIRHKERQLLSTATCYIRENVPLSNVIQHNEELSHRPEQKNCKSCFEICQAGVFNVLNIWFS